jgi:hypothetical protein
VAGSDKTVKVKLVAEVSPYARGMGEASAATSKLGRDIDNVEAKNKGFAKSAGQSTAALKGMAVAGAAVAGTALVAFLSDSVKAAGDLEQSIGGVDAVFKDSADQIHEFGKTAAESVGLSRNEFNELITVTGALLKNKGLQDFTEKSLNLVKIGADLSATYGGSAKDAVEALNAAMRGESDPIERYGISINETAVNAELAAKGLNKLTGSALEQAKAQARIDIITRQSADALGKFAAEADTLQGQQQRLNAEWEDAKASLGNALLPALTKATEAMRGGIDAALAIASAFEGLPGPVKAAVGALIALHLLRGPLGTFLGSTISQVKSLGSTLKGAGIVGGAKAAGSALMGAFGGPLGLAVGAGTAALAFWADQAAKTDAIANTLKDTIDKTSGAFTTQSRVTVKEALFGDLSTEDIQRMKDLGVDFDVLADAALKGGPALERARSQLDGLKNTDWLFIKDDADIINGLQDSLSRAADGAERSKLLFGELKSPTDDAAKAVKGIADAAFSVAGGFDKALPKIDTLSIREGVLKDAADAATQSHKDLADAILGITNAAVDADKAEANWQKAIDDVTDSVKENGKTVDKTRTQLNLSTEAGRANQDALIALRDAAVDNAKALLTQGDSTDKVKSKMKDARKQFIDAATDMGLNKESANKLADQYGITEGSVDDLNAAIGETPAETKTKITAETQGAELAIKGINALLDATDGRIASVRVTAAVSGVTSAINNVGSLFGWTKKADGGLLRGPGTSTSDSIPALLSDGEYVIKAAAVKKYGKAFFDQANSMRFASGGHVSRMATPSSGGSSLDMERLAALLGDRVNVNVQASDPARTARQVVAELEWRAVNG